MGVLLFLSLFWPSVNQAMFHRTVRSPVNIFAKWRQNPLTSGTPRSLSRRIRLGLQEGWPVKGKQILGSELWVAFQNGHLGFLIAKTGRQKGSTHCLHGSLPSLCHEHLCSVLTTTSPPRCLMLRKRILCVLPLLFCSHLSFLNSFLNTPPVVNFNIILWVIPCILVFRITPGI